MTETFEGLVENILPADRIVTRAFYDFFKEWHEVHSSPPSVLFHYTSAEGLMGILDSNRLWATDARFTNDPSEVRYATRTTNSAVEDILRKVDSGTVDQTGSFETIMKTVQDPLTAFFTGIKSSIRGLLMSKVDELTSGILDAFEGNLEVYMVSFCGLGDLLSQWRGYGSQGGGYSIGFVAGDLASCAQASHGKMLLRKVIYEPDEQRRFVDAGLRALESLLEKHGHIIDDASKLCAKDVATNDVLERLPLAAQRLIDAVKKEEDAPQTKYLGHLLQKFLVECLLCFKDPAFKEEQEWRLIQLGHDTLDLKFRVKSGQVLPYVELDLASPRKKHQLPIQSVIHGPGLDPEITSKALKALTKTRGYREAEVRASGIPYRE